MNHQQQLTFDDVLARLDALRVLTGRAAPARLGRAPLARRFVHRRAKSCGRFSIIERLDGRMRVVQLYSLLSLMQQTNCNPLANCCKFGAAQCLLHFARRRGTLRGGTS